MARHYITTAIDYTNGVPHIGHAYEKVLADVLARFYRLKGGQVFLLTGVDQHGQKVQQSAEKEGVAPQDFVDGITIKFRALWEKLEVRYDGWAATTDPIHKTIVRAILQRLWDEKRPDGESKWLYRKSEGGYYSVRQEQFLTDKERGENGEFGSEWQPVEFREEENFYFRLVEHKQWLLDLIDRRSSDGKPLVAPAFRIPELRNAVEKLDGDLCISRPASRLRWGIPFPESFGAGFVTFVWFDALINYLSFAPGYDPAGGTELAAQTEFQAWWPALHVIGKDILVPAHGVYWPIMLKALGFDGDDIPTLLVHGWWNIRSKAGESEKMSKSLGNVIDPNALAEKYGVEALRYYLMSDIATGRDADFSEDRLVICYQTDLANKLGNLLNRTLSMVQKYRAGTLRHRLGHNEGFPSDSPLDAEKLIAAYQKAFIEYQIADATHAILEVVAGCNALIDERKPWAMAKDPAQDHALDCLLYQLAEFLRIFAVLLSPVLPQAAQSIFDQLAWKLDLRGREDRFQLSDAAWGGLPEGHVLGTPTPIFPRLEPEAH